MKITTYSAPAKIIFTGEHAVVYGKPGLVCAVDKRITIDIYSCTEKRYEHDFFPKIETKIRQFLQREKEEFSDKPYCYSLTSDIPIGRGMGSSAALAAASSAALLEHFTGKEWSLPRINQCAYEVEKIFHLNPSGVDVSASVFGGLIWYRKEFEFLKSISSLTINIPKTILDSLFLIDSGKPQETTAQMVSHVGLRYNKYPRKVETIMGEIERTSKRFVISIMKEDVSMFAESLQKNQELLEQLGVISNTTKQLLTDLKMFGTGKVTGAGGRKGSSGYILYLAHDKQAFLEYAKKKQISVTQFHPIYKGVARHNI